MADGYAKLGSIASTALERWRTSGLARLRELEGVHASLVFDPLALGDVGPTWTMDRPLRRDADRRTALVELDAIAAIMLGLSAEQLCAMYRTQFAVLRKYECAMAFGAQGRKICAHHQSAGYRKAQLQAQAKAGELPKQWKNVWKLFEDWEGRTPFGRLGRALPPAVHPARPRSRNDPRECHLHTPGRPRNGATARGRGSGTADCGY